MIDECDLVALLIDLPDLGLVRGDVGTVAMVHGRREGFEVEFVNAGGQTIGVETLMADQVKKITESKAILHVSENTDTTILPATAQNYSTDTAHQDQLTGASVININLTSDIPEQSTPSVKSWSALLRDLPVDLLDQKSVTPKDIRLQLAIILFQNDIFSLGKASEFTGLHPAQFQQELANRQLSVHYDRGDYEQDVRTLETDRISQLAHHHDS